MKVEDVKAIFQTILIEPGSEEYTARKIRERASVILKCKKEDLETEELKDLLSETIDHHIENINKGNFSEDDSTSQSEIEDELDDEGNTINSVNTDDNVTEEPKIKKQKTVSSIKENRIKSNGSTIKKKTKKIEDRLTKLKSYVFKCGVRKVWKKELEGLIEMEAISRVQCILEELGMEGRPTLEKCKKIKEKREYDEEMKIINKDMILDSRLRRNKRIDEKPVETKALVNRLDLSAFGDSE